MQTHKKDIKHIEVCHGTTCLSRGSDGVYTTLQNKHGDNNTKISMCSCLGHCRKGPNVLVDENKILNYSNPASIVENIHSGKGNIFKRFTEAELFNSEDFLGDL